MERHVYPTQGFPLNGAKKCIIIYNDNQDPNSSYYLFCKHQLIYHSWASETLDPTPVNIDRPDVFILFCTDLGWNSKMLKLYDIFIRKGKVVNLCLFDEEWTTDRSLGTSELIPIIENLNIN